MKKNNEKLELVGHLQVTDQPLLSLYVTQGGTTLFFFYRLNRNMYYLTKVTPNEVIDYLDEKMGLLQIYTASEDYLYHHKARHSAKITDFVPMDLRKRDEIQGQIKSFDMYDDLFGLDEVKVRHYLKDNYLGTNKELHKEQAYG